jgi:site-specific recombinase XerD
MKSEIITQIYKKMETENPKYLMMNDLLKMLAATNDTRDSLLLMTLYETGCTLGELVEITLKDVSDSTIAFKDRESIISQQLSKDLMSFALGNRLGTDDKLFSTRQSQSISQKRVRQLINKYSVEAGLGKINPHIIRNTHIAHAYSKGMQEFQISKQVGLTRLRVFQILQTLDIRPKDRNYYVM